MSEAKLTSKGQITVPKRVRDVLAVHPGDRLAFRIHEDGTVSVEAETIELGSLRGAVRPRVRGVTVEAMNETIRRRATRR